MPPIFGTDRGFSALLFLAPPLREPASVDHAGGQGSMIGRRRCRLEGRLPLPCLRPWRTPR